MYTARLDAVVCREGAQSLSLEAKRPEEVSRLSNATSEGELILVGTWAVEKTGGGAPLVRPTSESLGKTRYISTTTWPMVGVLPSVSKPVKVAPVIEVWEVEGEVIAGLDLKLSCTLGSRGGCHETVPSGAEEEWIGCCW